MDSINLNSGEGKKILDMFSSPKIGKTTFKLPRNAIEVLVSFSKENMFASNARSFLDLLAEFADSLDKKNELPEVRSIEDGERKSFAISEKAKETFKRIALKRKISRDELLQSVLDWFCKEALKLATQKTPEEKIKYAETLKEAANKMLDILYEDEVRDAINSLKRTQDKDFEKCSEHLAYIETLNEFPDYLDEFIRRKKNEEEQAPG